LASLASNHDRRKRSILTEQLGPQKETHLALKHVTEMTVTPGTEDLSPAPIPIGHSFYGTRNTIEEGRPATPNVKCKRSLSALYPAYSFGNIVKGLLSRRVLPATD
jgi:hypothetical protein